MDLIKNSAFKIRLFLLSKKTWFILPLIVILLLLFGCFLLWPNKPVSNSCDQKDILNQETCRGIKGDLLTATTTTETTVTTSSLEFNGENVFSFFTISKNKKVYYLKEGNIWVADLNFPNPRTYPFLDVENDILTFDISNDQEKVAFSLALNTSTYMVDGYSNDELNNKAGDTIVVVNMVEGTRSVIFSDKDKNSMRIRDIKFSPNGEKVFFTNRSIWVADLETGYLRSYFKFDSEYEKQSFYMLSDISPSGLYILAWQAYMEGGFEVILNTETGKEEYISEMMYVEPALVMGGFVTDNLLLSYIVEGGGSDDFSFDRTLIELRDVTGRLVRKLENPKDTRIVYFDNHSWPGKIFLNLIDINNEETAYRLGYKVLQKPFYELDTKTFALTKAVYEEDFLVVTKDPSIQNEQTGQYDDFTANSFWLTGNKTGEPVLIDSFFPHLRPIYQDQSPISTTELR